MALGKRIKELREAKGLSQDELSDLTNNVASQGAISALEKRDSTSSKYAGVIAKALGVDSNELYGVSSYTLTPELIEHLKVMQQLPDYARTEVIRDALKRLNSSKKSEPIQIKTVPITKAYILQIQLQFDFDGGHYELDNVVDLNSRRLLS